MSATESTRPTKYCFRENWTPLNIGVVVAGLIVFWPIGLFLLCWVLANRDVSELPGIIKERTRDWRWFNQPSTSGNRVFDEFQQTQLDRIDEIKREIKERYDAFKNYKAEKDRKAEQNEFEEFMKQAPTVE
ncbi:MAG: DUF2852 domain-containing protein [Verrucomicrobiota bacterium]